MNFYTSDTHFGHENIIKYCNRPFKNADHMDRELIRRWNAVVTNDDDVFILGDFTLYGPSNIRKIESYVQRLNGKKHLILGNHDRLKPFQYVRIGFRSVHTLLDDNEWILTHDPANIITDKKRRWLCGHVHNIFHYLDNVINVGVDVWGYYPVAGHVLNQLWAAKNDNKG